MYFFIIINYQWLPFDCFLRLLRALEPSRSGSDIAVFQLFSSSNFQIVESGGGLAFRFPSPFFRLLTFFHLQIFKSSNCCIVESVCGSPPENKQYPTPRLRLITSNLLWIGHNTANWITGFFSVIT